MTPDVEKYFADQILRHLLVANQAQDKPVDALLVAHEEGPHGQPVASCDPLDQSLVRSSAQRRRLSVQRSGRIDPEEGLNRHWSLPGPRGVGRVVRVPARSYDLG
jgi:hypothetical protein